MLEVSHHGPLTRIRLARTFLGRPLRDVSAYLIDGVLIDSGPPATAQELVRWLEASGEAARLRAIVHTHHHEDHVGASPVLARKLGVPIYAPAPTVAILGRPRRVPLYRWLVWGGPGVVSAEVLPERLEVGELRLRVFPSPGHAFDHVCLFEERLGWLFAGDLYVHPRVKYLRRIEDPWQHLASIDRALSYPFTRLVCAHAGVVEEARQALEAKRAYWRGLALEARSLAGKGLRARAITRRLLGAEGLFTYLSGGDFSKANLIKKLLAPPPTLG